MNRINVMVLFVLTIGGVVDGALASVDSSLDECRQNDLERFEVAGSVAEFGFARWQTACHTNLYEVIKPTLPTVLSNMCSYATNQIDRYLVLSAGWCAPTDSDYVSFLAQVLAAAERGSVRLDEVKWFVSAHHDMRKACTLARCYDQPGVSNVVDAYERVVGLSNYCNQVRTGEKKREVEEFLYEMSILRCDEESEDSNEF